MKWLIKIETVAGEILNCFTFNGSSEDGVCRAKTEAAKVGFNVKRVWAEQI